MTSVGISDSVKSKLAALHEERVRTWPAELLEINVSQRSLLVATHHQSVQVGDIFPDIGLKELSGENTSSAKLIEAGPVVVIFFRFAGCPACNIALPHYRDALYPALQAAGVSLVAISPQPPALLGDIVERHDIGFPVLSDPDLTLTRALGISYIYDEPSRILAESRGTRAEELNGTSAWELPKPAVFVVDRDRKILFVDISPDWMVRTEVPAILDALGVTFRNHLASTADDVVETHAA